jgi:hypothetical protein
VIGGFSMDVHAPRDAGKTFRRALRAEPGCDVVVRPVNIGSTPIFSLTGPAAAQ